MLNELRLALNQQTAKLRNWRLLAALQLRLALNQQTAKLPAGFTTDTGTLRLALNQQTAKLAPLSRPWKQGRQQVASNNLVNAWLMGILHAPDAADFIDSNALRVPFSEL